MNESETPERESQIVVSRKISDGDKDSEASRVEEASSEDKSEEWMDILGNGQLKKRIIKEGEKDVQPQRGDICTMKIVGALDDGTVVERYDDMSIQIGDLEVVQVLLLEFYYLYQCLVHIILKVQTAGIRPNDCIDEIRRSC